MMYPVNVSRGRSARRLAAIAAVVGASLQSPRLWAATETQFTGTTAFNTTSWNTATNWSGRAVPASGVVADVYKSATCSYNVNTIVSAPDLAAVQVAGNTSSGTAFLSFASGSYLQTGGFYVGAQVTGQNGTIPGLGIGQVTQANGSVNIDAGGLLAIDPNSSYSLSGNGTISASNEQNAGTFTQNGASTYNSLTTGATISNSGTYTIVDGTLNCDGIANTGTFNIAGGTMNGPSGAMSFANNGALLVSAGTLIGTVTNNVGATITSTGTTLPFTGSLINNGKLTVTGATGTITSNITGSGLLVFNGTGSSATLAGTNTFTGQTTVAAGTLTLASPVGTVGNNFGGALEGGVIVATGATLVNNANLQIANTSALTINGGTYNLNNHDQTVGSLTMNTGLVQETSGPGLGISSGSVIIGKGTSTISGGLRANGTLTLTVASNGTVNILGAVGGYNSSAASLIMTGGGIATVSGASALSSIDVKQGTLQLSQSGNLGGVNVSATVESGGTLSLSNQSLTIGDLIGSGGVSLGTGGLTVVSTGSTFPGSIFGGGSFTKSGAGVLTLTGADSSSGLTDVSSGTLTIGNTGSISGSSIIIESYAAGIFNGTVNTSPAISVNGSLTLGPNPGAGILIRNLGTVTVGANTGNGNGQLVLAPANVRANRTLLIDTGITLAGTTNAWTGRLDLSNNDMDVQNYSLGTITNEVKAGYNAIGGANGGANGGGNWSVNGITSSTAAADTTHLTALGVILNNDGTNNPVYGTGTALGLFDGSSPALGDVLVKFTYVGDANLDGKLDGSDYSRIDNGFLLHLTGWYNGDFNYDGVINGTDYTLLDNAFNTQGASLSATVAAFNAQLVDSSAIPEPTGLGLCLLGASKSFGRRRRPVNQSIC